MSQRGQFFDSTAGDRIYTSAAMAQVVAGLTGDGIVDSKGSELEVIESNPPAMTVRVGTGLAFILGYYFEVYSAAESLPIAAAHATLPRIDRIVIRRSLAARSAVLAVITGTPAASPAAPALTQAEAGTYELPLAQVAIAANATSIVTATITDERGTRAQGTDLSTLTDLDTGHRHEGTAGTGRKVRYTDVESVPTTFDPTPHDHSTGAGGDNVPWTNVSGKPASFTPAAHVSTHQPGASDPVATAVAGSSAMGDAVAAGSSASLSRADHRHGRESFAAPAIVLGTAAAAGAATTPIRSDATIVAFDGGSPAAEAIGDSTVVGSAAVAARRDHRHAMPAFGGIDPYLSFDLPPNTGGATTVSRSDHGHGTPAAPTLTSVGAFDGGAPAAEAIGDAAVVGSANATARRDHRHAMPSFGTVAEYTSFGLPPNTGAAVTVSRGDHGHGTPTAFDGNAPAAEAIGDAAVVGVAGVASRRDHRHAMPSFGGVDVYTSFGLPPNTGGAATISRSDHGHGTPALPTSAAIGAWAKNSQGGGAAGSYIWVGTTDPAGAASEGDLWVVG